MGKLHDKETIADYPENYDECYWCGKVVNKDAMIKDTQYSLPIYICKECQPK